MKSKRVIAFVLLLSLVSAVVILSLDRFAPEVRADTAAPIPQPYMVKDINENGDSFPGPFSHQGGDGRQIIFRALDTEAGSEPLIANGTEAGTKVLKDIVPGPDGSSYWTSTVFLEPVTLADGRFFFVADDSTNHSQIWTSDGSEAGTLLLLDACPTSIQHLVATDEAAFFTAYLPDEFSGGCGFPNWLWKTDGTVGGTVPVWEEFYFEQLVATNSKAFFVDDNSELWEVGEQSVVPQLIAEYIYGELAVVNDNVYFYSCPPPGDSCGLWITDGTSTGTRKVKNSNNIEAKYPAGDVLYFLENENGPSRALWVTDGTSEGTKLVRDGWTNDAGVVELTSVADIAYFTANSPDNSRDLWRTDGTPEGTMLVKDFHTVDSGPYELTAFGGKVFFSFDDGSHGVELWASDGTEQGTQIVADINPNATEGSGPHHLAARGDTLYFAANDGQYGFELWALFVGHYVPVPLEASFAASPLSGPAPLKVYFTNLSGGDYVGCRWDFGDGGTSDTCEDQSHNYTSPGNFTVSLTVTGSGGEDTVTKESYVLVEQYRIFLPTVLGK